MRIPKPRFLSAVVGLLTLGVVSLSARNQAFGASESVLWSFGNGTDGSLPFAGLLEDGSGNLFGTTYGGGANGRGTVFELTTPTTSAGNWTETILWNFGSGADGTFPDAGLIRDKNGNLYGTTVQGGTNNFGTVFKLTPPTTSGGSWTQAILWSFDLTDGDLPEAGLIRDTSGNLYGTTYSGGSTGLGTAFKLRPPTTVGGNWSEEILWNFGKGADGQQPLAGLIMDANRNLYGTTYGGGTNSSGTVFELTPPATVGGKRTETILWNFGSVGSGDGEFPSAGLIMDPSGHLYGTTFDGGAYSCESFDAEFCGTVFELTPPATRGENWTEAILSNLGGAAGANPQANLIMDKRGDLYGTTTGPYAGALVPVGAVFELTPPLNLGETWTELALWNFADGTDGQPYGGLVRDKSGNLYGTASVGGAYGRGTIFEISSAR